MLVAENIDNQQLQGDNFLAAPASRENEVGVSVILSKHDAERKRVEMIAGVVLFHPEEPLSQFPSLSSLFFFLLLLQ